MVYLQGLVFGGANNNGSYNIGQTVISGDITDTGSNYNRDGITVAPLSIGNGAGGAAAFSIMPPYYTLANIMKL
jgi:hypothetical protein